MNNLKKKRFDRKGACPTEVAMAIPKLSFRGRVILYSIVTIRLLLFCGIGHEATRGVHLQYTKENSEKLED